MISIIRKCAVIAAFGGFLTVAVPSAFADVKNFEFQLVQTEVKQGDTIVAVRLINKRTEQPVLGAVIFTKRIDMAPDGMGTMVASLEEIPSTVFGEYRFKTNLSMQGRWQLSIGAKLQGENGSVQSKLILKAVP